MSFYSRLYCFSILVLNALTRVIGQTQSPPPQDRSPSQEQPIKLIDWDKFDFLYTLHEPPQHLPKHSDQIPFSPKKQIKSKEEEEKLQRKRKMHAESSKKYRKNFKTENPLGYKEYNEKRYRLQKELKATGKNILTEEKKEQLKAAQKGYQAKYNNRRKAETGYAKIEHERYAKLKALVDQGKANAEQIANFESERDRKREAVRLFRLRQKQSKETKE